MALMRHFVGASCIEDFAFRLRHKAKRFANEPRFSATYATI